MLEKFLPRQDFDSYEDFKKNYTAIVPQGFNFAYDVVDAWAEEQDDKPALAWMNDESPEVHVFSFGDMKRMSNQAANFFKRQGIRKGDVVMLILKQRVEVWVCMIALHKIGAIVIPATFLLTKNDISYRANAASVKMIVAIDDPTIVTHVNDAMPDSPTVKLRVSVGNSTPDGWLDFRKGTAAESTEWVKPTGDDYAGEHDTMLIYFTSGTSSHPKMVLHDFTLPIGHIVTAKYWQHVEDGTRHMTASDSGWAKFAWGKIYGQWICGAVIAAYDDEKFKAANLLNAIEKLQLTTFCAPPTIYRFLIKEDLTKYDFSHIKQCSIAGEPLNPEVYNQWLKMTGLPLVEGFGQSETSVLIANFQPWIPIKPGSTGKFSPIFDIELIKEDGTVAEDGEDGVIVIRNAEKMRPVGLFREYFKNPESNAVHWKNGDYWTGDMAHRDEDGYIWFVGRNDDVIKCSGYRISPFEVESALMEHPAVLECAVTAADDPVRGQVVKATVVIVKNRGYEPTPELVKELQTHVKTSTAPYKYPRIIEFVDALPKSISGKIQRGVIRKMDIEKSRKGQA
ncbi:MAG: AMP-binding protein [Victivallales bacterium]|nr:AMP-binding protein [Victivallales bacterium]